MIGIIGKTQGVRFSARPPRKRISSVSGRPCERNVVVRRSFGAADSGVKFCGVFCVVAGAPPAVSVRAGAPATTPFSEIATVAVRGGRQTLSLHAW